MLHRHPRNSARVIDGKLVLSFPNALSPVLWQFDLCQVKASALEVLKSGEKGDACFLQLRTARGETQKIAEFETMEEGRGALLIVSRAMEKARGRIRCRPESDNNASSAAAAPRHGFWGGFLRFLGVLAGLFLIWLLVSYLYSLYYTPQISAEMLGRSSSQSESSYRGGPAFPGAGNGEAGVPMDADAFLMNNR